MSARPETYRASTKAFLPDFCAAGTLLVVVLVAELIAIAVTLASHGGDDGFLIALSKTSLYVLWLALLGAAVLCQLRGWLERSGKTMAFVLAFFVLAALCLALAELAWQLMRLFGQTAIFDDPHGIFVLRTFAIGSIVIALGMRYLYVSSEWRRSILLEAQARIGALQALIRPHFLFNSMNTIASLTRSDPRQAEAAVEDLSDLLRVTLQSPDNLAPLQQEIEVAKIYERIEKLRLGDRLSVRWQVDDLPAEVRLPTLTLQPLLENAIYHGIEPLEGGGEIVVSGRRRGSLLELELTNPIAPKGPGASEGNRMALDNIRERFELAFAGKGSVTVDERDGLFRVTLSFPERAPDA